MADLGDPSGKSNEGWSLYAGRWIACLGERVIGQGGTPEQALLAAKASRSKEKPLVVFVPMVRPFEFSPLLERVRAALSQEAPVYLVGGAVRDAMLGNSTHDLDFLVEREALPLARKVADALGAAFYALDKRRGYGRVILEGNEGERAVLDFTTFQGADLESDLRARDFTINAMAVDLRQPQALLDPLGGGLDLREKRLRACSPQAFLADPVRILRGIRLAAGLEFHVLPETRAQMRQAVGGLAGASAERCRDELFRILEGPRPSAALSALDLLGALPHLLPELPDLKGVSQPPPHVADVWRHSLDVVQRLTVLLQVLAPQFEEDSAASLHLGLVSLRLGRFRAALREHLQARLNQDRPLKPLLALAALYHDIGKPATSSRDEQGRLRFLEHDRVGAEMAARRAQALQLSNAEAGRLTSVIRHHMRPLWLAQTGRLPSRRAIYRFFRDTGSAGVDICLLSLADVLGTYAHTLPQDTWAHHVEVIRALLEAWWERPEEKISPPPLLTGKELIEELGLAPGPLIGKLLELLREEQATGKVRNRQEALARARQHLEQAGKG